MPATASNVDKSARSARMLIAASVLVLGCQVPIVPALSVKRADAALGKATLPGTVQQAETLSFLSLDQVPGATPAYVDYGKPEFTTFSNLSTACKACVEFWPTKEDGKRFHAQLYEDAESGGVWERTCRAGHCDFRDPQTDPVGGVIGKDEDGGKVCITRDPVPWFSDCEPVLLTSTNTLLDATRYCSYREQIFIPPPTGTVSRFGGKPEAWARIGGVGKLKHEQCLATIEREGSALFDSMTFCDADLPALSGCCETVFSALSCVAESAPSSFASKQGIFATLSEEASQMVEAFSQYCVPLCQNTKEEFCEKFPSADPCVNAKGCTKCTSKGGLWCPKLESCHCPSNNPPCIAPPITTPLQCFDDKADKGLAGPGLGVGDGGDGAGKGAGDDDALCKYKDMARKWKPRE